MSRNKTRMICGAAAMAVAAAFPFAPAAAGDDPLRIDISETVATAPASGSRAEPEETAGGVEPDPPDCSGLSAFGARLLDEVSGGGARNAAVSPLGAGVVLAMLSQGGSAPVRAAIRELAGDSPACGLAAILNAAATDERIETRIANGAFADLRLDPLPAFRLALRERFDARVERLDFAAAGAAETINARVSEKTEGAISSLIERFDPDDRLALVNAIHFRGEWTRGFDPDRTAPAPFRLRSGATVDIPAMRIDGLSAGYRSDADFEAVSVPYGDYAFAFAAVLPRDGMAPEEALGRLTADPSWLAGKGFRRGSGALQLPRLALDGKTELLPLLETLGLADALRDKDAFAGIAAQPTEPDRLAQHVVIEVEERGTTASVATFFGSRVESIPVRFDLRIDRPFAFSIRHVATGAVMFAAWVDNPAAG